MDHIISKIQWNKAFIGFVSSFLGISLISLVAQFEDIYLLVPSFGASAVLIFAAPQAPMAKHKNVLFGHLISASVGVALVQVLGVSWLSCALAVSLSIAFMIITNTLHPPGGATALYALLTQQDWGFILLPMGIGIIGFLLAAKVINSLLVSFKTEEQYSRAVN